MTPLPRGVEKDSSSDCFAIFLVGIEQFGDGKLARQRRGQFPGNAPQALGQRIATAGAVFRTDAGTIRVLHMLRPLGVAMAGRDIVDPYRD